MHSHFYQYPYFLLLTHGRPSLHVTVLIKTFWLVNTLTNQHSPMPFVVVFAGPLLSPLGVASVNSYGAVDWDDDKIPTSDGIGVIGKGRLQLLSSFLLLTCICSICIVDE